MKRSLSILLVCLVAAATSVLAAGCEDAPAPPPDDDGPLPTGLLSDTDLPVPADYEDEADTKIHATNSKAELDQLEKEIDSAN